MPSDVHGNFANDGDAGEMPTMIGNCHGNGLSDEASGCNVAEDVPLQEGTLSDTGERKKSSATTKKGRRRLMRRVTSSMMEAIEVGQRVFAVFMRVVGAIFVCVAVCLISFVTYTYFTAVLPVLEINELSKVLLTFVGVFLVVNAVYNYFKAMLMNPGTPPDFDEVEVLVKAQAELNGAPAPRQCKKCSAYKAERSHHCRICGRCVLKMDHHCPWINNCVGFRNYRNFCLFLLFLALSCLYCLVVFYPLFKEIMTLPSRERRGTRDGRHNVMTSFTVAGSVLFAVGLLGGMHVYLVLSNQTTIEFQLNFFARADALKHGVLSRNQYNIGRRRNFQQVFGPSPFCYFTWLLSWLAPPPAGDGLEFPSNAAHRR